MESLRGYGCVRGMENSEEAVAYNRNRGREVSLGSVERMPFSDDSFDLVLALDVIEHVADDLQALKELFRTLRGGGSLLVTVPALRILWSAHDVANGHYRRYIYFNTFLFQFILALRWF